MKHLESEAGKDNITFCHFWGIYGIEKQTESKTSWKSGSEDHQTYER